VHCDWRRQRKKGEGRTGSCGLRECPFQYLRNEPDLGELVTFWLTDHGSYECFPPPLTEAQVAAIYRHLVSSVN
jgi:hypothetical protein